MTPLSKMETESFQFPIIKQAVEIKWKSLNPEAAKQLRKGEDDLYLTQELLSKLLTFNNWLRADEARSIVETIAAIAPGLEGNRQILLWLRGEHQVYDNQERRHRRVKLIDFEDIKANALHVTWNWTVKSSLHQASCADVVFFVNGIPVCMVEHKNSKGGEALEGAIKQMKRYEMEAPNLIGSSQIFLVPHLLDCWYGVTWNVNRRDMAKWKEKPEKNYRYAIESFFEPAELLRTLQHWILFYVQDNETRKSILRQHQRRAVVAILERCADPKKTRGLIWHTQGSGKTFTLLISAKMILENHDRFQQATVILVVDRTELEGQLKGWIERLLGEMQNQDIAIERAYSKSRLQELLDADFRGLIIVMIHKFAHIRTNSCLRDNVYVFIDEAHRSIAKDFGTYMIAAVPHSTLIGFTGTPIDKSAQGKGTFKIFGIHDEKGYLDKYSIRESIEDETTLPIKYMRAPSNLVLPLEKLNREFFEVASSEGLNDMNELTRVLERAKGIQAFLMDDKRIHQTAAFIAHHFKENVAPLGLKAFVVAINREACAKYKEALDKHLPPEWSEAVYTKNQNDLADRPLIAKWQLFEDREEDVRTLFKKSTENPKILIVTDKLLTGYDAPLLYCLYLDKPMRDHVLLQTLARVNRPYIDPEGRCKKIGLVVDFVNVLTNLNQALKFDSCELNGIIENLDLFMEDFKNKMTRAKDEYLKVDSYGATDKQLESLVYGKFLDLHVRKQFFAEYKELESLWEILFPSEALHGFTESFKRLAQLYTVVFHAYAEKKSSTSHLAHKTRKLVKESVSGQSLNRPTKSSTFDLKTLGTIMDEKGSHEKKVIELVRVLHSEIDACPDTAPILQPLKERANLIVKELESLHITSLTAMDQLVALAKERESVKKAAKEKGLSSKAFAIYWALQNEPLLKKSELLRLSITQEAEKQFERFPHAAVNSDEHRQLRAAIYAPLVLLSKEERSRIVDLVMGVILRDSGNDLV